MDKAQAGRFTSLVIILLSPCGVVLVRDNGSSDVAQVKEALWAVQAREELT